MESIKYKKKISPFIVGLFPTTLPYESSAAVFRILKYCHDNK